MEILGHSPPTHMFEHADRADRVERPIGEVAVVLEPNLDLAAEAALGHAFSSPVVLFA